MGGRERHRRDWEDLAAVDPLWAVLSDPGRRGGGWEAERDAFYGSGEAELRDLEALLAREGLVPPRGRALDFGCGVGRITTAMAGRFAAVVGIDHSARMVEMARAATAGRGGEVTYRAAASPDVAEGVFDLVWSRLVIQHQPSAADARRLVGALADRVGPGGVLHIQLPVVLGWRRRLQPRRRAYALGRRAGIGHERLHRLGLNPIRMVHVPEERVRAILTARGLTVVHTRRTRVAPGQIDAEVTAVRRPSGGDGSDVHPAHHEQVHR